METDRGRETRKRVIAGTIDLINRRGLSATSVSDVMDHTGVKKGNLYFHFGNKEELVMAALEDARAFYDGYLGRSMEGDSPLERLGSLLDAVRLFHERRGFVGGCLFGNTALETADGEGPYAGFVRGVFDRWFDSFRRLLEEARDGGGLPPGIDPESASRHIVASLEGGIMLSRLYKRPDDLARCVDCLKAFLGVSPNVPGKKTRRGAGR